MDEATDYLEAACEHANALSYLYDRGHHGLAIYAAGLAVECLFRAYRAKKGLPFTSDHKLATLANEAGFLDCVPERDRVGYDAALTYLIATWPNGHRFKSESEMRQFLKQSKLDRGIKGDYLRENTRRMTSNALVLIGLGVKRWTN